MKAFISYSSKDAEAAEEVLAALENDGISCFYAPRDIRTGHLYADEIMANMETSDVLVLILSRNSNSSQHVLREVERAVSTDKPIIVYRIEEVQLTSAMEYFLMTNQWLNKSGESGLRKLAQAVAEAGRKRETVVSAKRFGALKNQRNFAIFVCLAASLTCLSLVAAILFIKISNRSEQEDLPGQTQAAQSQEFSEPTATDTPQKEIHVGDTVTFGTYNSQAIAWRVLDIDEQGACTLIASQVLCMKGFEGAQSGNAFYNLKGNIATYDNPFSELERMEALGSNDWERSSLRAWLNSENENVSYPGQPPIGRVFCDGDNPYHVEPGFLKGFTGEEREAILPTDLVTRYHDPATGDLTEKTTVDRVYIPSMEEVQLLEAADVNLFTAPTEEAIAADSGNLYKMYCEYYNGDTSEWWLRTPLSDSFCELYCVSGGYVEEIYSSNVAALGDVGVRPMMRVKKEYLATH